MEFYLIIAILFLALVAYCYSSPAKVTKKVTFNDTVQIKKIEDVGEYNDNKAGTFLIDPEEIKRQYEYFTSTGTVSKYNDVSGYIEPVEYI